MEARLAFSRAPSLRPMTTTPQRNWYSAGTRPDSRRHSHCDAVVRHIPDDHGVGADQDVVADANATQHLRTGAYVDVVANGGRTWLVGARQPHYHAVADTAVVTESRETADHDATEVIDDEIAADPRLAGQFDSGEDLDALVEDPVHQGKRHAQQPRADSVTPPPIAIYAHDPEALRPEDSPVGNVVGSNVVEHACEDSSGWDGWRGGSAGTAATRARSA